MKQLYDALLRLQEREDSQQQAKMVNSKRKGSFKIYPRTKERKSWFSDQLNQADTRPSVKFALTNEGSIKAETYSAPNIRTFSQEEVAECWWGGDDFDRVRCEVTEVAQKFARDVEYHDAAQQLLNHSSGRSEKAPLSKRARKRLVETLVSGRTRGLEFEILTILKQRQLKATKALLQTQDRLRDQHTWTQRAHLLALKYRRVSAYSAVWARLIAMGDEIHR